MAKTISPGGPIYREFASNIYGEILANFDADDSLAYVLIYKNQTSVDIKKHAGTIYFVHPDNKKRLLKVCPISTGDAMCRTRRDFEIARGCTANKKTGKGAGGSKFYESGIPPNNPGYEHFLCMAKWKIGVYPGNGKCGTSCTVNEEGYDVVPKTVFESMDTTCDEEQHGGYSKQSFGMVDMERRTTNLVSDDDSEEEEEGEGD